MPSSAIAAIGTLLKRGNGATVEVFTTIAEVNSLRGPGLKRDTIDVTSHSSTGGYREFILGLRDGGEVRATLNFVPSSTGHKALLADFDSGARVNYQIVFPDAGTTTWGFATVVASFEVMSEVDQQIKADVTFKVSGAPTLPA